MVLFAKWTREVFVKVHHESELSSNAVGPEWVLNCIHNISTGNACDNGVAGLEIKHFRTIRGDHSLCHVVLSVLEVHHL